MPRIINLDDYRKKSNQKNNNFANILEQLNLRNIEVNANTIVVAAYSTNQLTELAVERIKTHKGWILQLFSVVKSIEINNIMKFDVEFSTFKLRNIRKSPASTGFPEFVDFLEIVFNLKKEAKEIFLQINPVGDSSAKFVCKEGK